MDMSWIPRELLAELTQSLIDANTLLEDLNRATGITPDIHMADRQALVARMRREFFADIPNNQPIIVNNGN
jgi:hypothetical protein